MNLGQYADELLARLKLLNTADNRTIAIRKVNGSYKEIVNNSPIDWPWLKRDGEIVTVPNYTDGTVTITLDSRTVTGASTVWTSAMEGRYFQPQGSSNWYKIIKVVSGTELTLYSPIIEASASSQTYTIWKRYYYFPSAVRKVLDFGSWISNGELTERSIAYERQFNSNMALTGDPIEFIMAGADPFEDSYTTGTVSLTKDNDLMTGAGTSWLGNVSEGEIVTVGTNVYRVKRVESDTTIRLLNKSVSDVTGSSYSIETDNPIGFQLWYNPNTEVVLPYIYSKYAYDMVNESYDRPEVPEKFEKAILDGAEADRLSDLDDSKWINKQSLYAGRIKDLIRTSFVSTPKTRQMRPRIKSRGGYI